MKETTAIAQKGSLRRVPRAHGRWAWEWRYINPYTGKQDSKYFSGEEFPTRSDVEKHLEAFIKRLNTSRDKKPIIIDPSIGDLLDRFIKEEHLLEIKDRKPGERAVRADELSYSTAVSYLSVCNKIRAAWGTTKLDQFEPEDFQEWLKDLDGKPKSKGNLKSLVNRLFNKAMLYKMLPIGPNPIGLVEVRGITKRKKRQVDLTIEQCFLVFRLLPRPYHEMALSALCTGMRAEEILALDWNKIDFERLCMKVEEAVVHGRIGPVKTEYSDDELPLDPEYATILLDWKLKSEAGDSGLVFPSHVTGRSYHASSLQQDWIRRAGWCLVPCPECGVTSGKRCIGINRTRQKRSLIQLHSARRDAAFAAKFGSIGWHTFRHKYRTLLSQAETPLDVQQKLLRHADIRTTTQYGEVPEENKRKANSAVVRTILNRRSVH